MPFHHASIVGQGHNMQSCRIAVLDSVTEDKGRLFLGGNGVVQVIERRTQTPPTPKSKSTNGGMMMMTMRTKGFRCAHKKAIKCSSKQ